MNFLSETRAGIVFRRHMALHGHGHGHHRTDGMGSGKHCKGFLFSSSPSPFFLLHILTCLPLHFHYPIVSTKTIGPVHFNPLCASFNHIFSFTFHGLIEQNVLLLPVEPASQTPFACSFISATCSVLSWEHGRLSRPLFIFFETLATTSYPSSVYLHGRYHGGFFPANGT